MTEAAYIVAFITFALGCIAGGILAPLALLFLIAPSLDPEPPFRFYQYDDPRGIAACQPMNRADLECTRDEYLRQCPHSPSTFLPAWDDDSSEIGYCNELDQ